MTPAERRLLADLAVALDDWLHQYEPLQSKAEYVQESTKRIWEARGTPAYVAALQQRIREALG